MKIKLNVKPAKPAKIKRKIVFLPSTKIAFRYTVMLIALMVLVDLAIPEMLNYGPEMINTQFNKKMSGIMFDTQMTIGTTIVVSAFIFLIKYALRDVDKWYKTRKATKIEQQKIYRKCMNFPYTFLIVELLIPVVLPTALLILLGAKYPMMILKINAILLCAGAYLAINTFCYTKDVLEEILNELYREEFKINKKRSVKDFLEIQTFILIFTSVLLFGLFAYSVVSEEKSDFMFERYSKELSEQLTDNIDTTKEIKNVLKNINIENVYTKFIINMENEEVYKIDGAEVSEFITEYAKTIAINYDGRLYGKYGTDIEGVSKIVETNEGEYLVAIMYKTNSEKALLEYFVAGAIICLVAVSATITLAKSVSNRLKLVNYGFDGIIKKKSKIKELAVVSNDEIGELVDAFNKIQKMNLNQINTIKENHEILMEHERLASLGQMIGGIAHNLKTPIFSMAGGLEGLNDLIDEYEDSIEDERVTDEDMHAIAADMREWVRKLKGQISYMSDVVTAVKGQSVKYANEEKEHFTVSELFKGVEILTEHDIKQTLTTLEIKNDVSEEITIFGSSTSLVQVIYALVLNAIEGYGDSEKKKIVKLGAKFEKKTQTIILTIQDYGMGLPKEVQEKLFKEMVTTKGKNGTGLGLYMAQSNIKAHFKGEIEYDSKVGKGTTFYIKIPAEI